MPLDDRDCLDKQSFIRRRAERIAVRMRQHDRPGAKVRIYLCRTCGGWHLGHGLTTEPDPHRTPRRRRTSRRVVLIGDTPVRLGRF